MQLLPSSLICAPIDSESTRLKQSKDADSQQRKAWENDIAIKRLYLELELLNPAHKPEID